MVVTDADTPSGQAGYGRPSAFGDLPPQRCKRDSRKLSRLPKRADAPGSVLDDHVIVSVFCVANPRVTEVQLG
jgi:hypothetical protein